MSTQRESSRAEWSSTGSREDINSGSLQRIADACEKMASSYDSLRNDRDSYKLWYLETCAENKALNRKLIAMRGALTKAKKKASTLPDGEREAPPSPQPTGGANAKR